MVFNPQFDATEYTRCPACKSIISTDQVKGKDLDSSVFECTHCTRRLIARREGEYIYFLIADARKIKRMAKL